MKQPKRFLDAGWQVTVIARNASKLNLDCAKHDIDLTNIAVIRKLPDLIGEVDVVINNAGVMYSADFREYGDDKKQAIIKLNLEAPIEIMTVFAETLTQKAAA